MSAYDTVVLGDGPVGYWKLDETSGTVAADSSGNGLDGTYTSSPTLGAPAIAPGLGTSMDTGTGGPYVRVPHNALFDFNTGAYTVEAWINPNLVGSGYQEIVTKSPLAGYRMLMVDISGVPAFIVDSTFTTAAGPFPFVSGNLYHFAVVTDPGAGTQDTYLNGSLVKHLTGLSGLSPTDTSADLIIGELDFGSTTHFYQGTVSNVAVYGAGLSSARIAAHFSAGMASGIYDTEILTDTPVGYWVLNGAGITTPVFDLSTNANDGAYLGGALTYQNPAIAPGLSTSLGVPGDGQAQIPNIPAYDFITGPWSVEFWIKPTAPGTGFQEPVTKGATPGYGFLINSSSAEAQFYVGGSEQIAGGQDLAAGLSYHFVMTMDPGTSRSRMYMNGSIIAVTSGGTLNPTDTGSPFVIGGLNGFGNKYNGFISNVAAYASALSDTRIGVHYAAGITASSAPNIPVPNVVGESLADATADIVAATLSLGTVTHAFSSTVPLGHVISQNPTAGTLVVGGTSVNLLISLGASTVVPDLTNTSLAIIVPPTLAAANLVLGSISFHASGTIIDGNVISQSPVAGSVVMVGTAVNVVVSTGLPPLVIPDIFGLSEADARAAITSLGFVVGAVSSAPSQFVAPGAVQAQNPSAGIAAAVGTIVSFVLSTGLPLNVTTFDFESTVISQYANSPTLLQLCSNMNAYIDQSANFADFYNNVWNVDTAVGFGLDIWGKIVGVSRLLQIPNTTDYVGFDNSATPPPDWQSMGSDQDNPPVGGALYTGHNATQTYLLPDDAYRQLIFAKAFANICTTTAPAINQILQNLYGAGTAWVLSDGPMAISYNLSFIPSAIQLAILEQSGVIPTPPGCSVTINTGV